MTVTPSVRGALRLKEGHPPPLCRDRDRRHPFWKDTKSQGIHVTSSRKNTLCPSMHQSPKNTDG